ncbi:Arylsulfatase [Pontiella desulfatans]|uniref:Arylsulfatase n=1 Tax=Pontiella desulfatans TaxID=2750659 RepID=A0A6C2U063_PONDE|nr:arylsulfatase [Pontiella desulfatans]SPS73766.1 sulfatase S1_15 [Kiritimatiellales bacterium]VGO13209.1 Arylsulfatase [Pontiella desulfatans]
MKKIIRFLATACLALTVGVRAEVVTLDFTTASASGPFPGNDQSSYTYDDYDLYGNGALTLDITVAVVGGATLDQREQGWGSNGSNSGRLDFGEALTFSFSDLGGSAAGSVTGFTFVGFVAEVADTAYTITADDLIAVNGVSLAGRDQADSTGLVDDLTWVGNADAQEGYDLEDGFTGNTSALTIGATGSFSVAVVDVPAATDNWDSMRVAGFQVEVLPATNQMPQPITNGTVLGIDFGVADGSAAADNWNVVSTTASGSFAADTMVDTAGNTLEGISFSWTAATDDSTAPDLMAGTPAFPDTALDDALLSSVGLTDGDGGTSDGTFTLIFAGLDTNLSYDITLGQANTATGGNTDTAWTIGERTFNASPVEIGASAYVTFEAVGSPAGEIVITSFPIDGGMDISAIAALQLTATTNNPWAPPPPGPPSHYDDWAGRHGLTNTLYRPSQDADGDRAGNAYEWATGSNPTNPASRHPFVLDGSSIVFKRNTNAMDMVYYLQSITDLTASNAWKTLATNQAGVWNPPDVVAEIGTNNPVDVTVPVDMSGESEFYRLGLEWKNPNIIIIYADDLGYGDLGCYGATKVQTPNIDRLATEGRRFTDAHSASAVCTPSRLGMLTGDYPFRHNIWGPAATSASLMVPVGRTTVPSMLKSEGYETAIIGKWHLGFGYSGPDWNGDLKPGPLEVGFDSYFGVPKVNSGVPYVFVENHRVVGLDPADPLVASGQATNVLYYPLKTMTGMSGGEAAHLLYRDYDLGNQWAARATQWIEEHQDHPFFLYLPTTQIHHPFTPDPRWIGTSQCGLYGDFIHEFDWIVGQVMDTLDALGLAENTLIIVTSDNGGMLNGDGNTVEGGKTAWNAGHKQNGDLLGWKFGVWEGGHRIPLIARWPGKIEAGSISGELMSSVDFLATFAAITGRGLEEGEGLDSFNMLPAFLGNPAAPIRDTLLLQPRYDSGVSFRKGNWMYIPRRGDAGFGGDQGGPGAVAWTGLENSDIDENGNYVAGAPTTQLYDLENDLSQTVNVVTNYPDIATTMADELTAIRSGGQTRP